MRARGAPGRGIAATAILLLVASGMVGSDVLPRRAPPAAAAQSAGLLADAWVTRRRPTENFGDDRLLRVARRPVTRAYLRFRVPPVEDPAAHLELWLFVSSGSSGTVDVHRTTGGWTERGITFRNAPRPWALLASQRITGAGWLTLDLGPPPSSGRTLDIVLTRSRRSAVTVASSEAHARRPGLGLGEQESGVPGVFAHYYLWWTRRHWHDRLGPSFPYEQSPLPLPATLEPDGCNSQSLYEGNMLTDSPAALYTQDDAAVIERHVRAAASAGLSGFLVDWHGTGELDQTPQSIGYSRRLEALVEIVHRVNQEGVEFDLWLGYEASATIRSTRWIEADLAYLEHRYADDPALDRTHSDRPMLVWLGSRKYPVEVLEDVTEDYRDTFFFVGDENWKTWTPERGMQLDGNQYYWSSQNPYTNPASFSQLATLAEMVRSSGPNLDGSPKLWFAPFAPGYNSVLLNGSTCVPRNDGETMQRLFEGNAATDPDGWVLISWNEISEGTYVEPLQRYEDRYLSHLETLIQSQVP